MEYIRGIFGILVLIFIGYLFSNKKRDIDWRLVGIGLSVQVVIALLLMNVAAFRLIFNWVSKQFVTILNFSEEGSKFLFGNLINNESIGFIFALQVLPTVLFFSTLTAGLYYIGFLQIFVKGFARIMSIMRISGAESISVAGNIFLGQTESPLLVKPFIKNMTNSELMVLMTGGMATISGGVLAGYVIFLGGDDPVEQTKFAAYLLTASLMNAPAAIVLSKIIVPETEFEKITTQLTVSKEDIGVNLLDALAKGTGNGLTMVLNIGAMLLSFIALIAATNYLISHLGEFIGINDFIKSSTNGQFDVLTLDYLLGQIFRVFAFIIGVDWAETIQVGSLLGKKIVVNEFVAYLDLSEMKAAETLSPKSILISTYALCGFANFSSIAIQIGGIGALVPSQQENLSRLGMKALLAGTLATLLTATIAGVFFNV